MRMKNLSSSANITNNIQVMIKHMLLMPLMKTQVSTSLG